MVDPLIPPSTISDIHPSTVRPQSMTQPSAISRLPFLVFIASLAAGGCAGNQTTGTTAAAQSAPAGAPLPESPTGYYGVYTSGTTSVAA
jgi:hypothetical protein